jgi:hypothetical protein
MQAETLTAQAPDIVESDARHRQTKKAKGFALQRFRSDSTIDTCKKMAYA